MRRTRPLSQAGLYCTEGGAKDQSNAGTDPVGLLWVERGRTTLCTPLRDLLCTRCGEERQQRDSGVARTALYDGLAVAAAQPHTQVRPIVAPCWFSVPVVPTTHPLPRVLRWTRPSGRAPLSRYALSFAHRFVGSPNGCKKKGKMESDDNESATAAPLPPPPEAPHGETPPRLHGAVDPPLPRPLPASRQTWLGLHATSPPPASAYLSHLTSSGDAGTTSPPPRWPPPPPRNLPSDSTLSQDTAPPQPPSLARAHAGRSMHALWRAGGQVADAGSGADGAAHTAEAERKHYRRRKPTRSGGSQ